MTEAKHTPGPWKFHGSFIFGEAIDAVAQVWAPTIEEQRANARLVAAAPDLLAACEAMKEAIHAYTLGPPTEDLRQSLTSAVAAARDAITKAKGETE